MLYVLVYSWLRLQGSTLAAVTAAAAKALSVYWLVSWMLGWISLAPKLAAALLFAMSWPQFITAVAGAAIARSIASRLRL